MLDQEIRKKFIVTADDYGIRQTAAPILRLVQAGKIDRVAVLVHYVTKEQAEALLQTGVKIDLHMELITVLKSGDKVYDNVIKRIVNFVLRYYTGIVTKKRIGREWEIQIHRFQSLFGQVPDGLNSHEHLHYYPAFFKICLRLAEKYDIPFVRFGKNGQLTHQHSSFTGIILAVFSSFNRSLFTQSDRETTDYHVSLDWFPDFPDFCQHLPSGSIELVVHPEREEDYLAIEEYL